MTESRSLELKLESTIDTIDAAELIVEGLARKGGFDDEQIDSLTMAVRETVANAVTHGNKYSGQKSVHLAVRLDSNGLKIKVRDEGEGFDLQDVPDPTDPANLLKASGRGLLLMRALVDDVTVRRAKPRGTEVVLIKHGPDTSEKEEKLQ